MVVGENAESLPIIRVRPWGQIILLRKNMCSGSAYVVVLTEIRKGSKKGWFVCAVCTQIAVLTPLEKSISSSRGREYQSNRTQYVYIKKHSCQLPKNCWMHPFCRIQLLQGIAALSLRLPALETAGKQQPARLSSWGPKPCRAEPWFGEVGTGKLYWMKAIGEFNPRREGNWLNLSWEGAKRGDESGIRPGDGTRMVWWLWPPPSFSMLRCLEFPGLWSWHSEAPPAASPHSLPDEDEGSSDSLYNL